MDRTINPYKVLLRGEEIYFDRLKTNLEQTHFGEYVVIDIDSGAYITNINKIEVINCAKKFFGEKQLYVAQIGYLNNPTVNAGRGWIF